MPMYHNNLWKYYHYLNNPKNEFQIKLTWGDQLPVITRVNKKIHKCSDSLEKNLTYIKIKLFFYLRGKKETQMLFNGNFLLTSSFKKSSLKKNLFSLSSLSALPFLPFLLCTLGSASLHLSPAPPLHSPTLDPTQTQNPRDVT